MSLDPRTRRKLLLLRARMQAHVVQWFAEIDIILNEDAGPATMPADLGPDTVPNVHSVQEDRRRR